MADGTFISKKINFTMIQNAVARDKTLSMKAKGLYLVIQSYITIPGSTWKKSDFLDKVLEGEKAFDSAWKELKNKGYLTVHLHTTGKTWIVKYDLRETKSEKPEMNTFYYNSKGIITRTNLGPFDGFAEGVARYMEEISGDGGLGGDGNGDSGNGGSGNRGSRIPVPRNGGNGNGGNGNGSNGDGTYGNGSTAKGSIPDGSSGYGVCGDGDLRNGTDNIQYYNAKTTSNTMDQNSLGNTGNNTPSINLSTRLEAGTDGVMDLPVIMDPRKKLSGKETGEIEGMLQELGEIPSHEEVTHRKMVRTIQYIAGWNDYSEYPYSDELQHQAYLKIVKAIAEMATTNHGMKIGKMLVTAEDVLDQLNIACKKQGSWNSSLYWFIECTMDRFVAIQKAQKIRNTDSYVKTMIWNNFDSYELDFRSFFHRTFYGGLEE